MKRDELSDLEPAHEQVPRPSNRTDAGGNSRSLVPADAQDVLAFWRAAGPAMWFAKDAVFDRAFHDRFIDRHVVAAGGRLTGWTATAEGALALILLLDQFPRNAFRDTPRMYATDPLARAVADYAIISDHAESFEPMLQMFFYMPFAHSEDLADQNRSVALFRDLPPPSPEHALRHCDIIRRFGRFPHRNAVLGRTSTPEEVAYLGSGGYSG